MKRIVLILLVIFLMIFAGCATQRKAKAEVDLRGLMLLENTQLGINKVYHSKHYQKVLKRNYKKLYKKR
jgi:hypothetical protein